MTSWPGAWRRAWTPVRVCVSIAKGLDERGRTPAQVFAQHFGTRIDWAFLYGPMLARELHAGRPGFAMAASLRPATGERIQSLFAGTRAAPGAAR